MTSSLRSVTTARAERISAIRIEESSSARPIARFVDLGGHDIDGAAFDGQQRGADLGRHDAAGVLDEQSTHLGVADEVSGLAGEERAAAHRDAPPSGRSTFARVVELALGIKGASLVLKGPGAVASRPGPTYGMDRGRFEPGRTAGYGGPSCGPAGTETE
jgi:hypothetical protein